MKKEVKYILIILGITLLVVIGVILFLNSNYHKYTIAENYFNNEKYNKAIEAYTEIKDYKNSSTQIKECQYRIASKYYEKEQWEQVIDIFEKIKDYKNSEELLEYSYYSYGVDLNKSKDYEESNKYLERVSNFKDSKEYIDKNNKGIETNTWINKYVGTYDYSGNYNYLIYNDARIAIDNNLNLIYYQNDKLGKQLYKKNYECELQDDFSLSCSYLVTNKIKITLNEDKLIANIDEYNTQRTEEYEKSSDGLIPIEDYKEPAIGMTEEEVLNSTWGKPQKKNKHTYSWGTSEQWVYSRNRYIYFDDGIVTSISE